MQVDHPHHLLGRQLLPHVVHQVREHTHDKRALQLARRNPRAQQHTLVQQRVDLAHIVLAEVGRQNVPRRNQQLLARHGVLRRTVLEQPHVDLGQQVRVLPHDRRRAPQHVRQKAHRLHLRRHHLAKERTVLDARRDADKELAALPRSVVRLLLRQRLQRQTVLKNQRHKHVDRRAHNVAVRLENEHNRDRALGQHLEALRAAQQRARRRRRRLLALEHKQRLFARWRRRRLARRLLRAERLGDRRAHVQVQLLHELKERLHLRMQHALERAVQVNDHLERDRRILLVVVLHGAQHHLHQPLGVHSHRLVLRVAIDRLHNPVPQSLLRRVRHKRARRRLEQIHLHRQHRVDKTRVVHIYKHLDHLLDLGDDPSLGPQVQPRVRKTLCKRRRVRRTGRPRVCGCHRRVAKLGAVGEATTALSALCLLCHVPRSAARGPPDAPWRVCCCGCSTATTFRRTSRSHSASQQLALTQPPDICGPCRHQLLPNRQAEQGLCSRRRRVLLAAVLVRSAHTLP